MRLLKCYVENFGTINQFSYDFAEGLNIINEMNGWGKTTFAVFIKAMFYGMESSNKRNLDENERKKYMPWNGGQYGGYIVFRINNKTYRVERFFGNKEREDYFNLYDEETKLESDDYTDKLGEEIFKIDREAFARSTFVPQQQIKVTVNDSISAKLTNMIESDNDINNFELAVGRLDEAVKAYKKKGDKGKIYDLEAELRYAEGELNDCISKEAPYEEWKRMLSDRLDTKFNLERRLELIDKNIEYAGGAAERQAKKAHYEELKSEVETKRNEINSIVDFFNDSIPQYDDLNKYDTLSQRINDHRYQMSQNLVCDADREDFAKLTILFKNGLPHDNELDSCDESIVNVMRFDSSAKAYCLTKEEMSEYTRLDNKFNGNIDVSDSLSHLNKFYKRYSEIANEIDKEKNDLNNLENMYDINSEQSLELGKTIRYQLYLFLFAACVIASGLLFAIKIGYGLGASILGIGVLIASIAYLWKVKSDKYAYENEALCDKNLEDIAETKKRIEGLRIERKKLAEELVDFTSKYSDRSDLKDMMNILADINIEHKNYLSLKHKKLINDEELWSIKRKRDAEADYINKVLGPFYEAFGIADVDNMNENRWREILRTVRDKKKDYLVLSNKISIFDKNTAEVINIEPIMNSFLDNYYSAPDSDAYEKRLNELRLNLDNYHRIAKELETANVKYYSFEEKNKTAIEEATNEEIVSLETLQEERRVLIERINYTREDYDNIKTKCTEFSEVVSRKPEFETEVDRIKGELAEANKRFDILSYTKSFLERSKSQFSSRYLTDLNKSFNKYISLLSGSNMTKPEMDTLLNINVEAYGTKKELDYMSTGYKDLYSFCTRLALVDAMFVEEHPFLILDDPFVNLDENKIDNALELIKEVSKEFQIIYFVCHSSRV